MPDDNTQRQPTWRDRFTEREPRLIANCRQYAEVPWHGADPAGLPRHQLMLIIAQLASAFGAMPRAWTATSERHDQSVPEVM